MCSFFVGCYSVVFVVVAVVVVCSFVLRGKEEGVRKLNLDGIEKSLT